VEEFVLVEMDFIEQENSLAENLQPALKMKL